MTTIGFAPTPTFTWARGIIFTSCTGIATDFPTAYVGNTPFLGQDATLTFNNASGVGMVTATLHFPGVTLTSFLPTETVLIVVPYRGQADKYRMNVLVLPLTFHSMEKELPGNYSQYRRLESCVVSK